MDCDCNMPNCIECFNRYAEAVVKMDCADKELYYEWQELITQELHDDRTWEWVLDSYTARELDEIINFKW